MTTQSRVDRRTEYWDWLAVALFLLLAVDTLTTYAAARVVGVESEANPIMQWALGEGLWVVLAINLAALVLCVLLFALLTGRIEVAPAPFDRYIALLVEVWLGLLLAVGLALFANNLSVIVFGQSLL